MQSKSKLLDTIYIIIIDILKHIIPIVCVGLSAVMLSNVAVSLSYRPVYTSRCTMIVSAKINNTGIYTDATETEKLTDTINAVMTSTVLKKKTAETLGLSSFDGNINVLVIPGTNMLELSVTSSNPNTAFRQLKTLINLYPDISRDVLGKIVMEVFEEPSFPSAPSNHVNYTRTNRLSFIIGAGIVILAVALYSYYHDTIKNKWELEDKLDTKLVTVFYHEKSYLNIKSRLLRRKKRMLTGAAGVSFNFCETVKKLRTNISYFQDKTKGKVILFTSYDKKEGKTTIAANVAQAMAQKKQKVLVISGTTDASDLLDILHINLTKKFTGENKNSVAERIYTKPDTTLSVLTAPDNIREGEFARMVASENFKNFIARAKEVFDCIIIDGPSAKDSSNTEVFARISDFSILVVRQNASTATHINDTADMLNKYANGLLGCVFNNVYSSATVINMSYSYGYHYGYSRYGSYGKYKKYSDYRGYNKYNKYNHYNHYNHYARYTPESVYVNPDSER